MRAWYKYETTQGIPQVPNFSAAYFVTRDYGRLLKYFIFIRENIGGSKKVLSVGSGDCALEYQLTKKLHVDVTCTDIKEPDQSFKDLGVNYSVLDITKQKPGGQYDVVIVMGVLYLFDRESLVTSLKNIYSCLKPGGVMIIDYGNSSPNLISEFILDVYLPIEMRIYTALKKLPLFKNQNGYMMKTEELVSLVNSCGFSLDRSECLWDIIDLRRSMVFRKLFPPNGFSEKIVMKMIAGRSPYLRLMKFVKKENVK